MAYEHAAARYRKLYAKLLRLYPKPFRKRFGEPMEQTFNDLLCERGDAERGLFAFALWVFVETSAGIIKENITVLTTHNRNITRIAIATACILMVPLVAMQLTEDVDWSLFDFVVAGTLLFGTGLTYELVSRKGNTIVYRAAVGVAAAAGLLLIWINLAVGIIGSEDHPANLMYLGVIYVGLIGATAARLRPLGMARALFATAIAQALVPVIAMIIWWPRVFTEEPPGVVGVIMLNGFFVMLFVISALLFRHASAPDPT